MTFLRMSGQSIPCLVKLSAPFHKCSSLVTCFVFVYLVCMSAFAEQANEVSRGLNYLGAEVAGNAQNTIPAHLDKKIVAPSAWRAGEHYLDPFSDDPILFKIDASNLQQYQKNLSDGQSTLLLRNKDYFLPIYKTRRTAVYPKFIKEGTQYNRHHAKLSEDGHGIEHYKEGFPFPVLSEDSSQAALESLWNHRTRFRGGHVERTIIQATVFESGAFTPVTLYQRFSRAEHLLGTSQNEHDHVLFFYLDKITAPARLSGTTILVHETLNQSEQDRRAWVYSQAHKRVRRAPSVAYDAPVPGTYGLRTADSYDMFNGSSDKYDWQYLGKQELYVPYNAYQLASGQAQYAEILEAHRVNPDFQRWELHRVHKIEARLKDNKRHIYAKRVFYLDEDTWTIVLSEQYDQRGDLWRVSEGHLINYYDQLLPYYSMEVTYDLLSNRYNVFGLSNEESRSYSFSEEFRLSDYLPSTLRRNSRG